MSVNKAHTIRVGDVIKIYNNPNRDNLDYPFYGINKDKDFMPTVANTEGLDGTKYTLLKKGMFVFSGMQTGRDICIRIGYYDKKTPVLISPAYTTFIVSDEEVIMPQYLFLFFNRYEMDRYGAFLSDSSIRSNLDWERFCDIRIPLPPIETQRELVAVYNGLKTIAEENEVLLQPLSDACQAFIVDCKKKYPIVALGTHIEECKEKNDDNRYGEEHLQGVTSNSVFDNSKADTTGLDFSKYKVVHKNDFAYNPSRVNLGSIALQKKDDCIISPMYVVFHLISNELLPEFLQLWFSRKEFQRSTLFYAMGSVRDTFDFNLMQEVQIPLPPMDVQQSIVNLYRCYEEAKQIAAQAREQLKTICPALIQKAAHSA